MAISLEMTKNKKFTIDGYIGSYRQTEVNFGKPKKVTEKGTLCIHIMDKKLAKLAGHNVELEIQIKDLGKKKNKEQEARPWIPKKLKELMKHDKSSSSKRQKTR